MERAACNVLAFTRQDRDLRYGEPRRDIDFSMSPRTVSLKGTDTGASHKNDDSRPLHIDMLPLGSEQPWNGRGAVY